MTLEMKFREIRKEALEEGMEKGISQGISQGLSQGILQTYAGLVKDGIFSLEQATERSGISADKLAEAVQAVEN